MGAAALVAGDQHSALAGGGEQHLGLGGLAGAARLDLHHLDGGEAERSAGGGGAGGIVAGEVGLGSPQAPDRADRDGQAQGPQAQTERAAGVRWGLSTDQIFSIW